MEGILIQFYNIYGHTEFTNWVCERIQIKDELPFKINLKEILRKVGVEGPISFSYELTSEKDGQLIIKPRNLYTALAFRGINLDHDISLESDPIYHDGVFFYKWDTVSESLVITSVAPLISLCKIILDPNHKMLIDYQSRLEKLYLSKVKELHELQLL